ncbi:hypothetical protein Tco_1203842 [Tanacetum coccineum]
MILADPPPTNIMSFCPSEGLWISLPMDLLLWYVTLMSLSLEIVGGVKPEEHESQTVATEWRLFIDDPYIETICVIEEPIPIKLEQIKSANHSPVLCKVSFMENSLAFRSTCEGLWICFDETSKIFMIIRVLKRSLLDNDELYAAAHYLGSGSVKLALMVLRFLNNDEDVLLPIEYGYVDNNTSSSMFKNPATINPL